MKTNTKFITKRMERMITPYHCHTNSIESFETDESNTYNRSNTSKLNDIYEQHIQLHNEQSKQHIDIIDSLSISPSIISSTSSSSSPDLEMNEFKQNITDNNVNNPSSIDQNNLDEKTKTMLTNLNTEFQCCIW
jgi:hypothetical protein